MIYKTKQLSRILEPHGRYTLSPEKILAFRNEKQGGHHPKPWGLWYDCGAEWLAWVSKYYPDWLPKWNYVYRVRPTDAVLQVQTAEEVVEFNARYQHRERAYTDFIDWSAVAKDFPGVEFCPYLYEIRLDFVWYHMLDVPSGCIWNERGLDDLDLVAQRVGEDAWELV